MREGGSGTVEEVGTLDDVSLGMTGARRNSALALDPGGFPHVVFSDQSAVHYATRTEAGWQSEEIVTAGDRPLGQPVSFKLDAAGTPPLTLYEVTNANPRHGLVAYLTRGDRGRGGSDVHSSRTTQLPRPEDCQNRDTVHEERCAV